MTQRIMVIVNIVISAVLLGLVVVYCINWWIPADVLDWIIWSVMAVAGIWAICRISNLAKMLGNRDKE